MAKSSYYPKANKTAQWWEKNFPRVAFTKIEKIMFHTTETTGWPGYQNGEIAPTLTYNVRTREWRQHNFLDTSARALGDPAVTPVRENRDNIIQIEIIWYAKDIGSLPETAYQDLAEFVAYVRSEWNGPSLNYTKVGGPNDDVHLTSAQYDSFNGLIGHANAPKPSTHWDPGKLDYAKIVALVKALEAPQEDDMPTAKEIAKAVWDESFVTRTDMMGKPYTVSTKQELADAKTAATAAAAKNVDVDALAAAVAKAVAAEVGGSGGLTTTQVQAAAEAAVRHVLGAVDEV